MTDSPVTTPNHEVAVPAPRDPTPDLARGLGLLGIAVVNANLLSPHAVTSRIDTITSVLVTAGLENRSWPMFALMFGFGIAAIGAKLDRLGREAKTRNRILRRRNWWLFAFGLLQVILVFWGDILGVYGLTGMAVVALLHRSGRTRAIVAAISVATWFLGNIALNWGGVSTAVPLATDWASSIGERLAVFVWWTAANGLLLTHLGPMLVGVAFFELGALHRPAEHRHLHRRIALAGIATGLLGAAPLGLITIGAWAASDASHALAIGLHAVRGLAQGLGYVSLIALWSVRRDAAGVSGGPAALLAAIGGRSLTVYFVHSILLGLLLSRWAFDFSPHLTAATTYALGLGVWIACAAVALAFARAGRRGPADQLLRRLTYGRHEVG